uniref:Putative members of chemokine-like factor super family n=1 Tax=Corethrella appendiculata TaxID=1370023 RepID=U5EWT2_9DIPT
MSHSVVITRTTTTTTSSSSVVLNTGYLRTVPGLLKLAQLILGAVCVGIVAWHFKRFHSVYSSGNPEFFFLLMAVAFLIGTFCLLASCLVSLSTGGIISKTIYELIYHTVAFILYLAASVTLLVEVTSGHYYSSLKDAYTAASIIGLIISALYLFSAILAQRSYRGI